jgi:hypothetical protein
VTYKNEHCVYALVAINEEVPVVMHRLFIVKGRARDACGVSATLFRSALFVFMLFEGGGQRQVAAAIQMNLLAF